MDVKALDKALQEIVKQRQQLAARIINDPNTTTWKRNFMTWKTPFRRVLVKSWRPIFQEVHDEYCPDSDVLVPIGLHR